MTDASPDKWTAEILPMIENKPPHLRTEEENIADFYKKTAETIRQSYKAPRSPQYVDMLNNASAAICERIARYEETNSMTLGIKLGEYSNLPYYQIRKLLKDYLPEYPKAGGEVKDRFNQVSTGQTEKDAELFQQIRRQYLDLATHVSKALTALSALDREVGYPPGIEKLLPPEYVEQFKLIDTITHCDICGAPITTHDVNMSRTYCPDHGNMCDECRLKYLTEFKTHFEIEQTNARQAYEEAKAKQPAAKPKRKTGTPTLSYL